MSKKSWDTEWLNFSKRARRGALVFLFLFVVIAIAPSLYRNYIKDANPSIPVSISKNVNTEVDSEKEMGARYSVPNEKFDPNNYTLEEWKAIGLSEKQSQSILNYLDKGGSLTYKEDLQKLYVVDDELYELLAPQVMLPSVKNRKPKKVENDVVDIEEPDELEKQASVPVDINVASKKELMNIKGIGSFYADEIIDRRETFGGIYSLDQLSDLYKMTPEKLDSLAEYLLIDPNNIRKMNVNLANKKELMGHPLINADIANSIVFIRDRYGNYDALDGLLQSPYIDGDKLEELKPYLEVK